MLCINRAAGGRARAPYRLLENETLYQGQVMTEQCVTVTSQTQAVTSQDEALTEQCVTGPGVDITGPGDDTRVRHSDIHRARLRALSSGGSVASPPPSPAMPKYKLAEYRYGREEMLALYVKENKVRGGLPGAGIVKGLCNASPAFKVPAKAGDPGVLGLPSQLSPGAVSTLPSPSSTPNAATEFSIGDAEDDDGMKHLQQGNLDQERLKKQQELAAAALYHQLQHQQFLQLVNRYLPDRSLPDSFPTPCLFLLGIHKPQDGFTQWCEQMLHVLNSCSNLDVSIGL
ncbi:PERQ amino acid-rich with GYF domain-containing protein 2 [Chelonia mydas]|uniref:PERQ amino acid-rich with GYF domain-containing protein 2 n=1 Tax=Chelonia mydas TaxID=8469 RepID=M7BVZ4_CHEMY|nr:PERQ amino acid-rich with GYF domain-containing protein 2 [Chelonia mydas]